MLPQCSEELLLNQPHPLRKLRILVIGWNCIQTALEIIQDRKNVSQKLLVCGQPLLSALLLRPSPVVGVVGGRPLQLLQVAITLGKGHLEFSAFGGRLCSLRSVWSRADIIANLSRILHVVTPHPPPRGRSLSGSRWLHAPGHR